MTAPPIGTIAEPAVLQHRAGAAWVPVAMCSRIAGERFLARAANAHNWRLKCADGRVLTADGGRGAGTGGEA